MTDFKLTVWDRIAAAISPSWALNRLRARVTANALARHYEAAQSGSRRTSSWTRARGDADAVNATAIVELRSVSRDLVRNNAHAKHAVEVIANNTVGWGITPRPAGDAKGSIELWRAWADSTECDAEGRSTFTGMLSQSMKTIVSDGEVLIRRRRRRPADGLSIPLQIQILEADYLDSNKDMEIKGGYITQGVEFDLIGRRVAYWLFPDHPGSSTSTGISKRVAASEVIHCFLPSRPGQTRGISWFAPAIVTLKDLAEYEDAELIKQKIAACFSAFITDPNGAGAPLTDIDSDYPLREELGPGVIASLPPGKTVTAMNPPTMTSDALPTRSLRKVAAALGIGYEELTGDYSQVNFSSARMSRISHLGNLRSWQWNMLIPQVCAGVWAWAMEAAELSGQLGKAPRADWTVSPLPMIEPDKEGLAYSRLVRNGVMTPSDMVREQGGDPEAHFAEYAADMKRLDDLKIQLDCDVRAVSAAGLTQVRAGAGGGGGFGEKSPEEETPPKEEIEPERSVVLSDEIAAQCRALGWGVP